MQEKIAKPSIFSHRNAMMFNVHTVRPFEKLDSQTSQGRPIVRLLLKAEYRRSIWAVCFPFSPQIEVVIPAIPMLRTTVLSIEVGNKRRWICSLMWRGTLLLVSCNWSFLWSFLRVISCAQHIISFENLSISSARGAGSGQVSYSDFSAKFLFALLRMLG